MTLQEVTAAYTVFLEGVYHAPITYRRVTDPKGNVILENQTQGERVLSAEEAAIMTKLLESVTEDGTAKGLHLKKEGIAVAGKTGTTQDSCDKWFVGYTPRLLCGVWMGYDYPKPLASAWGNPCLHIWDDVMRELEICYERYPAQTEFSLPEGLVSVKLCPETGERTCIMIFISVDFPVPLGPTKNALSPRLVRKLTFSNKRFLPKAILRSLALRTSFPPSGAALNVTLISFRSP